MAKDDNYPEFVKRDITIVGKEYAQLLNSLKERFRKSQLKAAVKVNTSMLEYYWEMGRDISRLYETAKWGSAFFDCLSLDLKSAFPGQSGFSVTNIKYAKRWYEFYNQDDEIRQQVVDEFQMPADFGLIPWGHHIEIFTRSKSVDEAIFYVEETIRNSWSRAALGAEIDDNLYGKQKCPMTENVVTSHFFTIKQRCYQKRTAFVT